MLVLAHSREIEKETLEKETKLHILMTLATSITTDQPPRTERRACNLIRAQE